VTKPTATFLRSVDVEKQHFRLGFLLASCEFVASHVYYSDVDFDFSDGSAGLCYLSVVIHFFSSRLMLIINMFVVIQARIKSFFICLDTAITFPTQRTYVPFVLMILTV
jgi:hypothetical protein